MNKDMVFAYKVIFALSCMLGGTLAWGIKEHNEKKRQAQYACELKDIHDFESGMLEACIKVLGDIANKAVMNKSDNNSEVVNDANQSE